MGLVGIIIGLLLPQPFQMPVEGATAADYHPDSFWYHPWGRSGTHKGVDIFAHEGTALNASTPGLVLATGSGGMGGNAVVVLGPKWRVHYYAHLKEIDVQPYTWVGQETKLGSVGSTGNAAGKPPHLHYTIATLLPYLWRVDTSPQGWKKMFYLDAADYLD